MQVDAADALERADHEGIGGQKLVWTLALDCRSLKQGLSLSRKRACSADSSITWWALYRSSASQRSCRAEPLVVEDLPHRDRRHPPTLQSEERLVRLWSWDECMSASSAVRATTSGGALIGCDFAIGGRFLKPSRPSSWKRRFQS